MSLRCKTCGRDHAGPAAADRECRGPMTPDVSSVEAVVNREVGCRRWPSACRCSACCFSYEAVQQAAEQACYRYALAVLEGLIEDRRLGGLSITAPFPVTQEIIRLQQLIAGSA